MKWPRIEERVSRTRWWRFGRSRIEPLLLVALQWVYGHVRGLYAAVGFFLTAGFLLALLAAWGFAVLTESVLEGETRWLDRTALFWIHDHATPWLDVAALEVTALGNSLVIAVVVLVSSAFLWFTRHREAVFLLATAVLGNMVLKSVLKPAFAVPRPQVVEWRAAHAGWYSFPSGHAMTAMVVYATLAYLIVQLDPVPAVRRFTIAFATLIVLLVGLSRLYLGIHYPSDVLAGYAVGFAWAIFSAFGLRVIGYMRAVGGRWEGGRGGAGAA